VWSRRRITFPERPEWQLPALSRRSLEAEGFQVIERRQPSLLLGRAVLVTGEVDRTTAFETGMPFHHALNGADGNLTR
jgi:7,8-dihydropterin-6-yl-methyl-4-(beta-D-ribofuranosyl)aminobenzene 5'-phosphate synthase